MGVNPAMAYKQRETRMDGVLLKLVYPLLFSTIVGRRLLPRQVWHREVFSSPESPKVVEIAPRIAKRDHARPVARPLFGQKRAA
jgi:hypothetical protein